MAFMESIDSALQRELTPGNSVATSIKSLADIGETLAAGFARDPQKREFFQGRVNRRDEVNRQAREQGRLSSLERLKVYGQVFQQAGGIDSVPAVGQAFRAELGNLARYSSPEDARRVAQAILAAASVGPASEPFTLSPGQARFDGGRQIAALPPAAEGLAMRESEVPLPNGLIQKTRSMDGGRTWENVGVPYDRRDRLVLTQGVDEQGRQITQVFPRAQLEAAAGAGLEAPLTPLNLGQRSPETPMTPQAAALASALEAGTKDLDAAIELLAPGGKPDRVAIGVGGVAKGVPFTKGRQARQQMQRGIESILRGQTGAAAPQTEVDRYMDLFFPSVFDDDASVNEKLQRTREWLRGSLERMKAGRPAMQGAGAGQMPEGARKVGTFDGGEVWQTPDGRQFVVTP